MPSVRHAWRVKVRVRVVMIILVMVKMIKKIVSGDEDSDW